MPGKGKFHWEGGFLGGLEYLFLAIVALADHGESETMHLSMFSHGGVAAGLPRELNFFLNLWSNSLPMSHKCMSKCVDWHKCMSNPPPPPPGVDVP